MAVKSSSFLQTQKNEIRELMKKPIIKGEAWYVIDCKWFKQWKKYVGYDEADKGMVGDFSAHPGPIDNSGIIHEDRRVLKDNLTEEKEYSLLPLDAWDKLVTWYSLSSNQNPIVRYVAKASLFAAQVKVEIYLLELKLCCHSAMTTVRTQCFSHADTLESLAVTMRRLFSISHSRDIRLWKKSDPNAYHRLDRWESTLQDVGLHSRMLVIIESQNDDRSWSLQTKAIEKISTTNPTNSPASIAMDTDVPSSTQAFPQSTSNGQSSTPYDALSNGYNCNKVNCKLGLCGLDNLGNTCFLNSAIQCMSNIPSLTEYMINGRWRNELNVENLLGMRGEIARAYAELINTMWSGQVNHCPPRNFKGVIGRFKPEFSGHQQQDSQELMAFLLDGLHEDLNRIKNKPYIETKESGQQLEEVIANEAWADHKKRNNSVIIDTFHGLLKSTVNCPECSEVSKKFDPFGYLSLPLPTRKERHIEVFLVSSDPMQKVRQFKVTVPRLGIISQLCSALSKLANIPPEKMVVVDVYNHHFHQVFLPKQGISNILDRDDIFVYEVAIGERPDVIHVPVYMREDLVLSGAHRYPSRGISLFGIPLLVAVPRHSCTYDILYNCILDRMVRYVRDVSPRWWEPSAEELGDEQRADGFLISACIGYLQSDAICATVLPG